MADDHLRETARAFLDAEEEITANADPAVDEDVVGRFYRAKVALRAALAAGPPPTNGPTRSEMVERFREALMEHHHHDWDMETVAEAAHICADTLASHRPDNDPEAETAAPAVTYYPSVGPDYVNDRTIERREALRQRREHHAPGNDHPTGDDDG